MYDVENRSAVLENVAGFARLYGPVIKWQHRGMFIHWENKLRIPLECCMSQNASNAEFLGA